MAELKTKPRSASVSAFLSALEDPRARQDAQMRSRMLKRLTGAAPRMWGPSTAGFDEVHPRRLEGVDPTVLEALVRGALAKARTKS